MKGALSEGIETHRVNPAKSLVIMSIPKGDRSDYVPDYRIL